MQSVQQDVESLGFLKTTLYKIVLNYYMCNSER